MTGSWFSALLPFFATVLVKWFFCHQSCCTIPLSVVTLGTDEVTFITTSLFFFLIKMRLKHGTWVGIVPGALLKKKNGASVSAPLWLWLACQTLLQRSLSPMTRLRRLRRDWRARAPNQEKTAKRLKSRSTSQPPPLSPSISLHLPPLSQ